MDTVKKYTRVLSVVVLLTATSLVASTENYCTRSELQFFNTYASTIINPVNWNQDSSATIVFGYKPLYQGDEVFKKEKFLVKFSFHGKSDQFLVLRGDIHQQDSNNPENTRSLCWKTSLYFSYDLTKPEGYPDIRTLEGVSVPMIGNNLSFKTCELLSRRENPAGSSSYNEIITGTTQEGDRYNFWITYAGTSSLLKAFEGQRSRNAQTVFFETVGLKN